VSTRKPIIVGNWKMHKTVAEALDLVNAVRAATADFDDIEVGVAPPFTALAAMARALEGARVLLCSQNCHAEPSGAFTGEISLPMLADVGCSHVIVGHSERRQYFGEDDAVVNRKAKAVLHSGLTPIICVGERLEEREAGQTFTVVRRQLEGALNGIGSDSARKVVLAYEPVWAIGTGKTATDDQAQEVHAHLRGLLGDLYDAEVSQAIRIQYGGSVKPNNATGLMAQLDIDGALVGGASLKPDSFVGILRYERMK
jgi:triosephosphate isomerase